MNRMMKGISVGLFLIFFLYGKGVAADINKADEFFDKGSFQYALNEYESVFKETAETEIHWKAFFRICESLAHLFRYGDAAQKLADTKLPEEMPYRARILILQAELFGGFLRQYSPVQRGDIIDDEKDKDVFRRTPEEIKDEIKKNYLELWKFQKELLKLDIKNEGYFLDIKEIDYGQYPALFDYLILSWTDFLLSGEYPYKSNKIIKPEAKLIIVEGFKRKPDFDDLPVLLAAELMEEASRYPQNNRLQACERWKIKRLLLPLRRSDLFDFGDPKDYGKYKNKAKEILLKWMEDFKTPEAKAEAGYEAACILNSNGESAKAAELLEEIEEKFPGTNAGQRAKTLRASILVPLITPEFYLGVKTNNPSVPPEFTINTKNIKKVYFRFYRLDPEKIKNEDPYYSKNFRGWSEIFNYPREEWLKSYLPGANPYKEWEVETNDKGEHKTITKTITLPALEPGIYLMLTCGDKSFEIGNSLLNACIFNITDMVLIGTAGFTIKSNDAYYDFLDKHETDILVDEAFRFYALEGKTGRPVDNAKIDIYAYSNRLPKRDFFYLTTDKTGFASIPMPVQVSPNSNNNYSVDPLAKKEKFCSYWKNEERLGYSSPNPIIIYLETDRPIYRPGDKVQAKAIVLRRTAQEFKTLGSSSDVTFTAYDMNNKEFFKGTSKLNEFGSASINFELPPGRLLGRYSLRAYCNDGRYGNDTTINFSTEEYKRPEFEILLKPADKTWRGNEPVEIKGTAKYYFGGPVPDAPIKYHIKRQSYIPWHYRCWFERYSEWAQEIATGEVKSDSDGNFIIPFTSVPQAQQQYSGNIPYFMQFSVEVEGRDSGGRTISAYQSYKAGKDAFYFVMQPKKGFFIENEPIEIESKCLTINDTPESGKSNFRVYRLKDIPAKPLARERYGYSLSWNWVPPLDVQLKDVPNDKMVAKGKTKHDKDGKAIIKIAQLSQGVYRIIQESKDQWGNEIKQDKIFVVAKKTKEAVPINAASVMLAEKDEYNEGDVARFIIGSGLAEGKYNVEIWAGEHFLKREFLDGNQPVRLVEIPVNVKMKGGFSLRWFGIKDFYFNYNQTTVSVPWKEKKLKVSMDVFSKKIKPGEKVAWGIKINDFKDKPQEGEALALMYDRSLEYYMKSQNPWLDDLYTLKQTYNQALCSIFDTDIANFYIKEYKGSLKELLDAFRNPPKELKPPRLRFWRTWAGGYNNRRGYYNDISSGSRVLSKKAVPSESTAPSIKEYKKEESEKSKSMSLSSGKMDYEGIAEKVETRKAFADTAFFKPHITVSKNGKGTFDFTAPEQLTGWRIKVFAFTKDVKEGTLTEETVTKKDLMVRADIPRFFREKDKGTITAIVHNETDALIKGQLFIKVFENAKLINQKLKLEDDKKDFEIKPHSLSTFNWLLEIPEGITTYKVRVFAVTGRLSDAEERELPILPSRQRLVESSFIALSSTESKKIEILLKDDSTMINESAVLQVDPQLALTLLNTIPFLIGYPYGCVEQVLNKYVPLAIMNEIYQKYPVLKKAVKKIPKRNTATPLWEQDSPQRLNALMETPWVRQSEGMGEGISDLLNPETIKKYKEIAIEKIRSAQLPNGAFPWWPGGKPDPYMTLYVLAGFSEAHHYGVDVPKDIIRKAIGYVNEEIPLMLKPEESYLSIVAYAAYVLTSYSANEFPEAKKGHEAASAWVVFLEKYIYAMTPLGKAYLAYTYKRLGNEEKAQSILIMAMDGAREDPVSGLYWTPEKYSWIWYSDTVEKHAFLLRTLQELRPDDKRIPGMVQWLLFSRKGTVWKSTKASAAAVFALLDYMDKKGALSGDETFKIKWGKTSDSFIIKADDWLDKPLRWQEKGLKITHDMSFAAIDKKGPGFAFASLTWIYSTDQLPEASTPGMLELKRTFYRRVKEGDDYHLKPINSEEKVAVGDQIEVHLKINTRSQFEYMHLKDPKPAGFEAETLLSGWKYDPLWFYEEPRDSITNFFFSWLPQGEYVLRYRLRPTKPGTYHVGAATLQSMYSPEMTAHSAGLIIKVIE